MRGDSPVPSMKRRWAENPSVIALKNPNEINASWGTICLGGNHLIIAQPGLLAAHQRSACRDGGGPSNADPEQVKFGASRRPTAPRQPVADLDRHP
jgi:hypothetical protein